MFCFHLSINKRRILFGSDVDGRYYNKRYIFYSRYVKILFIEYIILTDSVLLLLCIELLLIPRGKC